MGTVNRSTGPARGRELTAGIITEIAGTIGGVGFFAAFAGATGLIGDLPARQRLYLTLLAAAAAAVLALTHRDPDSPVQALRRALRAVLGQRPAAPAGSGSRFELNADERQLLALRQERQMLATFLTSLVTLVAAVQLFEDPGPVFTAINVAVVAGLGLVWTRSIVTRTRRISALATVVAARSVPGHDVGFPG